MVWVLGRKIPLPVTRESEFYSIVKCIFLPFSLQEPSLQFHSLSILASALQFHPEYIDGGDRGSIEEIQMAMAGNPFNSLKPRKHSCIMQARDALQ